MKTISEIQEAVLALSDAEFAELRSWLLDEDWERWDRQIEEDVKAGRLDFLRAEVEQAKREGTLKELNDL